MIEALTVPNELLAVMSGVAILVWGYITIATVLFGCPYCLMPDMAWPVTLYRMVKE